MRTAILPVLIAIAAAPVVWPAAAGAVPVDYTRQIKPILHEKCNACHGALKQKAGLRTDAVQLLRTGGDNGAVVVPGKPDESLIVHAVEGTHDVTKMPKDGAPLSAEQLTLLRAWIAEGAKAADEPVPASPAEHWAFVPPVRPAVPGSGSLAGNPIDALIAAERDRLGLSPLGEAPRHLLLRRVYVDLVGVPPTPAEMQAFLADESPDAYEKVVDRLLADSRYGQRWGRHWMDVWRYSDWAGYKEQIRDSRRGIWRWRDWIIESLNADRPYDEMVRLMIAVDELPGARASSPAVAEGDALGRETFDPADLRAGGYLARSWFKFNKNVWMDNTVEHFGKAFLGLTLNCARCHDHKYDPVSQVEYYQVRAFFEPIEVRSDPVPGLPDPEQDGIALVYDKDADAPTYLLRRGDEKQPVKDRPISPVTPAVFGPMPEIKPVDLPPAMWYPGLRAEVRKEILAKAESDLAKARKAKKGVEAAEAELASVKARLAADEAKYALTPSPGTPGEGRGEGKRERLKDEGGRMKEGAGEASSSSFSPPHSSLSSGPHPNPLPEYRERGPEAERAERRVTVLKAEAALAAAKDAVAGAEAKLKPGDAKLKKAVDDKKKALAAVEKTLATAKANLDKPLTGKYSPLTATYPATSTGRRTALAAWVTSRDNPLAARVAINHIWMRHLGDPLVGTEFDFGLNGKLPTNQPLLDWLAVELMDSGWSMKHIHRLIVTSQTYRLSSGDADDADRYAANQKIDPDNVRLWRANVRRMDAEVVRDSLLAVAGKLDASLGGPELDQNAWQSSARRSLYYRHAYEKQGVFAMVFDAASPTECYRRIETITPQQSLALANSSLAVSHARLLAAELAKQASPGEDESAFVAAAFERILSRPATEEEAAASIAFLDSQSKLLKEDKALTPHDGIEKATVQPSPDPRQRARENFVHVLLNHNDFVTIR